MTTLDRIPSIADLEKRYGGVLHPCDAPEVSASASEHRRRAAALERRATAEGRELLADEAKTHAVHVREADSLTSYARQLEADGKLEAAAEREHRAKREANAAATRALIYPEGRVEYGDGRPPTEGGFVHTAGGSVYNAGPESHSFFRDMDSARRGDLEAAQRLARCNEEARTEKRALTTAAGAGGTFAPPGWLIEEFVALARAARVTADRCHKQPLPGGVSSLNLPKVSGGTSTAIQTSQNSALSQTDMTTGSVSSSISTIGGKQVVSRQLLDQSGIPFDQVILSDLAADYARQLDTQVISGSGASGQLNGMIDDFAASGTVNTTYTQATPSVSAAGGFYAKLNSAISAVATNRFLPPDTIVMTPNRWSWIAASFDSSNRPLVSPSGSAFNQIANAGTVAAQGYVGEVAGLPVYVDANLPTNLGAGTNQDPVLVGRFSDLYLWESDVRMESFEEPYADSAGVLFRVLGYSALIPSRYTTSLSVISGTGLVPASF